MASSDARHTRVDGIAHVAFRDTGQALLSVVEHHMSAAAALHALTLHVHREGLGRIAKYYAVPPAGPLRPHAPAEPHRGGAAAMGPTDAELRPKHVPPRDLLPPAAVLETGNEPGPATALDAAPLSLGLGAPDAAPGPGPLNHFCPEFVGSIRRRSEVAPDAWEATVHLHPQCGPRMRDFRNCTKLKSGVYARILRCLDGSVAWHGHRLRVL